jgi:hypothetical protein
MTYYEYKDLVNQFEQLYNKIKILFEKVETEKQKRYSRYKEEPTQEHEEEKKKIDTLYNIIWVQYTAIEKEYVFVKDVLDNRSIYENIINLLRYEIEDYNKSEQRVKKYFSEKKNIENNLLLDKERWMFTQ